MYYELSKLLSDISELLIAFAAKRIDKEQLHQYISDDIDMYINLGSNIFNIQYPRPVGGDTDNINQSERKE